MKDAQFIQETSFPAAGANNNSTAFDLNTRGQAGEISPEHVELEISWPAMAALADDKDVDFTVQDSADGVSFASLGMTHKITGAGGAGVAAGSKSFRLPKNARRYVRINQAEEAAGGDITGSKSTVSLIFH